jgi:molybdate transport system substrate-binding protein
MMAMMAMMAVVNQPVAAAEIRLFAPPSLRLALTEVLACYRERQPDVTVIDSYGTDPSLEVRIAAGDIPDIVLLADRDTMDRLSDRGVVNTASEINLLGDGLVLVAAADSTLTLTMTPGLSLAGALDGGRLAVSDPELGQLGRYGRAALVALGAWPEVEQRLVTTRSERATLAAVAHGQAPLGIVSSTDAAAEPGVRVVGTFPDDGHPAVVYPAALTGRAWGTAAAALFAYLHAPPALAIFSRHGFQPLP